MPASLTVRRRRPGRVTGLKGKRTAAPVIPRLARARLKCSSSSCRQRHGLRKAERSHDHSTMLMMGREEFLIRNVRPYGLEASRIVVRAGRIAAIEPTDHEQQGMAVHDGGGALLLPGLIDAHTHLDKSFLGFPWQPNGGGPRIIDFIE